MKRILLAFSLFGLSWSSSADPKLTIYGVELSKPLALPECEVKPLTEYSREKGEPAEYVDHFWEGVKEVCFQRSSEGKAIGSGAPVTDDFVNIGMPKKTRPKKLISRNSAIQVTVTGGVVEEINFNTKGLKSQAEDILILTAKFGEPKKTEKGGLQNAFGATFRIYTVYWDLPQGAQAVFFGSRPFGGPTLDNGWVRIVSAKWLKNREKEKANEPKEVQF